MAMKTYSRMIVTLLCHCRNNTIWWRLHLRGDLWYVHPPLNQFSQWPHWFCGIIFHHILLNSIKVIHPPFLGLLVNTQLSLV